MNKESKLIFTPQVARYLLKKGFTILDIKPDKEDKNKTIFVFKYEDGLYESIKSYKNCI